MISSIKLYSANWKFRSQIVMFSFVFFHANLLSILRCGATNKQQTEALSNIDVGMLIDVGETASLRLCYLRGTAFHGGTS